MRLLQAGTYTVKTSGATIQGQMWFINGQSMFWDGINWYSADAVTKP